MLLSLIVPVYNVEEYVAACLDSIYDGVTDLSSFEVIVINDGSTDGSARIVEGYRNRFDNLVFIEQNNQGLSAARMNGLARAQGEYLWFVDSDDWVEPNSVEKVLSMIREHTGFPVYIMPIRVYEKESTICTDDLQYDCPRIVDGWELMKQDFPPGFAQRYILRKSMFSHPQLYFPLGHVYEDGYFCPVLLALAGTSYLSATPLYHHRFRAGSISRSNDIRTSYDLVSIYAQLKSFAQTLSESERKQFMAYCQRIISLSYNVNETLWNTPEFRRFKRRKGPYLVSELFRNTHSYSVKEWMSMFFLLTSPRPFRKFHSMRQSVLNHLPDSVFRTRFWRERKIKTYMGEHEVFKLQIGCGVNRLPGWLNTDVDIEYCRTGALYLDAGEAFPFPDHSFDYVYSEHLFEHLNYRQAVNMLEECHRILKPSGSIRIATPDFRFLMGLYLHPEEPLNKRYIEWSGRGGGNCQPIPETALHVVNKFHTEWGHRIIYDRESLETLMREHGFKDIRLCDIGQSALPAFQNVERHFKHMPYEFYQLETMILEGEND